MKQWDDIIKDRLEGYESPIPEGALDRFHALQAQKKGPKKGLRAALVTSLAAAAAAAVFFIPKHSVSSDGKAETAELIETSSHAPEDVQPDPVDQPAQPAMPQLATQTPFQKPHRKLVPSMSEPKIKKDAEPQLLETSVVEEESQQSVPTIQEILAEYSTVPTGDTSIAITVNNPKIGEIAERALFTSSGAAALAGLTLCLFSGGGGGASTPWKETEYLEDPIHHLPSRIGLTASLPVSDKVRFVSGFEYFQYSSEFNYIKSGEKHQLAHYIGVPLRIDWVPVSIGRADIYLGGGLEGNFCVAASQSGQKINKDRPTLSLIGACGAQYRITDSFGIYLEPVLSWTPGSYDRLETYSTEHPLMLSVSTGLRFIIN